MTWEIDREDVIEMQRELSRLIGCPGREEPVARFVLERVKGLLDEAWIDPSGNVLGFRRGKNPDGERLLLDAHLDEVGFMVNHLEATGFLRIVPLGGIDKRLLPGSLLQFSIDKGDPVVGIIGFLPPHITEASERESVPDISRLFVDIGAGSEDEAKAMGIDVGSVGTFYTEFRRLNDSLIMGKAFDNRTACNVLIQVLKLLGSRKLENHILVNFAVQEERGKLGAYTGSFTLKPDMALAVENTVASDVPGVEDPRVVSRLGGGPAVTVADKSHIVPQRVLDRISLAAEKTEVRWQYKKPVFGGTDGDVIARTRGGCPTGVVAVPCRYIHGPASLLKVEDLLDTIRLVAQFCSMEDPEAGGESK